jgi:hypothetical protein
VLNQPPKITAVILDPSKFITVCEKLTITVEAEDPDGDELNPSYDFSFVSSPDAAAVLDADGAVATLAGSAGDYLIEVRVFDVHGQPASLTFPVHISDATCGVPPDVYAVLEAKCSPATSQTLAAAWRSPPRSSPTPIWWAGLQALPRARIARTWCQAIRPTAT